MVTNLPKKPVGAITPSSFSYENKAVEEACLAAGAKAVAEAKREAKTANFMVWMMITNVRTVEL